MKWEPPPPHPTPPPPPTPQAPSLLGEREGTMIIMITSVLFQPLIQEFNVKGQS